MCKFLNFRNFQNTNFELRKMVNNKPYYKYRVIENYKLVARLINFSAIVKKFQNEK